MRRFISVAITAALAAWLLTAACLTGYTWVDLVGAATDRFTYSPDELRAARYGEKRWMYFRALGELPSDAVVVLSDPPDDVVYFTRYYAYPRPVLKVTSLPDSLMPSDEMSMDLGARPPAGRARSSSPVYFSALDTVRGVWTLRAVRPMSSRQGSRQ